MSSVCQMLAVHPCDREPMDPVWPRIASRASVVAASYESDAHGWHRRADEAEVGYPSTRQTKAASPGGLGVVPRDVVYRREVGVAPPMPPCGRR